MNTEQETDPRVDLAFQRTGLALDRTQLAWIRTALSLIGAGVALDKGLQLLHQARLLTGEAITSSAHGLGISLTGISSAAFAFATFLYWRDTRSLARRKGTAPALLPPVLLVSLCVLLLGLLLFTALVKYPDA